MADPSGLDLSNVKPEWHKAYLEGERWAQLRLLDWLKQEAIALDQRQQRHLFRHTSSLASAPP
jgi:hypothetical protein